MCIVRNNLQISFLTLKLIWPSVSSYKLGIVNILIFVAKELNLPLFMKYHLAPVPMEKVLSTTSSGLTSLPPLIFETFQYEDHYYKLYVWSSHGSRLSKIIFYPFQFLYSPSPWPLLSAAAAKSLQSCPTLCDPRDCSPPGSRIPGILQARTLEWVAIAFSNAWKWKVKVKSLSHVRLLTTPWTAAYQAPPSMGFSRQEYWSGVPLPSLSPTIRI